MKRKVKLSMLRLRPYNKDDAETILTWIKDEKAFYKWTAGILGEYPISVEQFNTVSNLMAFTAIDDEKIVGFFTMRRPNETIERIPIMKRALDFSNALVYNLLRKVIGCVIRFALSKNVLQE